MIKERHFSFLRIILIPLNQVGIALLKDFHSDR
jgi:hypothetical protein